MAEHKKKNNENLYLSTIAFMDDDAVTTNERYLTEFCKMVIYQNGFEGLSSSDICKKINELVLFNYTEEEIEKVLNYYPNEIILEHGIYSISSDVQNEISRREKNFELRKYVDLFCDIKLRDELVIDRNELCNIVTKFIFEKFQQSIDQISSIIDGNREFKLEYSDQFNAV